MGRKKHTILLFALTFSLTRALNTGRGYLPPDYNKQYEINHHPQSDSSVQGSFNIKNVEINDNTELDDLNKSNENNDQIDYFSNPKADVEFHPDIDNFPNDVSNFGKIKSNEQSELISNNKGPKSEIELYDLNSNGANLKHQKYDYTNNRVYKSEIDDLNGPSFEKLDGRSKYTKNNRNYETDNVDSPSFAQLKTSDGTKLNNQLVNDKQAARNYDRDAYIVKYNNHVDNDNFFYDFESSNGLKVEANGFKTNTESLRIEGSYSFIDYNGKEYKVTYVADEFGFRPKVQYPQLNSFSYSHDPQSHNQVFSQLKQHSLSKYHPEYITEKPHGSKQVKVKEDVIKK